MCDTPGLYLPGNNERAGTAARMCAGLAADAQMIRGVVGARNPNVIDELAELADAVATVADRLAALDTQERENAIKPALEAVRARHDAARGMMP